MPPTRGQCLEDFGKWSGVMLRAEMRIDKANPASLVFSDAGLFVRIGSEAIFPIVPARQILINFV